ncbi:MAG: hypothetical protein E3J64_10385 [Anaerolineales bacterium]|nr:MAG: hypothetical protein E3J64_10385 [Anaerolineales bacterium]
MRTRVERIVDLLTEEIEQRLAERKRPAAPTVEPSAPPSDSEDRSALPATASARRYAAAGRSWPETPVEAQPRADSEPPSMPMGPPHAARLMVRLAIALAALIVVINIPFNRFGTTLATALPDSAAWVIVEGFVVTEEDDPEIYVFKGEEMRRIGSLTLFEALGYTWDDVHVAADGYMDQFEVGLPLDVVAKCFGSLHVYRLEGETKRWIRDVEAFTGEGYVWEDVLTVDCSYLRGLSDGETIPPGSGPPPQP